MNDNTYVKILAIHTDIMEESKITEETHKKNSLEAAEYIKQHPGDNRTIWIILPQ